MKKVKQIVAVVLTLSMMMSMLMTSFAADGEKTLQILTFNDFHGALKEGSSDMGWAKMVTAVNALKAENPNTIVVSAGDNFQGTAMSNLTKGEPVNEMMKQLGVVASAVGNHEFDWGATHFEEWATEGGYDFLASNIYDKTTGEPVTWAKPYKIVTIDEIKVGLIGLATPETLTKTKAEHVANLEFKDPAVAAQTWIDYLEDGKAAEGKPDVIIALTHLGADQDSYGTDLTLPVTGVDVENLCNNTTGLDAVVTGHTHASVAGYINNVAVVQGYKQGRALGQLIITINADNTVKSVVPKVLNYSKTKADLVADEAAVVAYEKWNTDLGPILDEVLGVATGTFTHNNDTNVSVLGKWVCEAMAEATDSQIAFQNGGGLRTEVPAGDVTYGLMYTVMPFDNTLVTMDLKGSDILKAVEHGIDLPTAGNGSFSGLVVEYDPALEYGSKVTNIALADGTALDMDATYKVVTNDFMVTGGDGYDFSGATNIVDTFIPIRDMLVDKVKAEGSITPETVDYVSVVAPVVVETPVVEPPVVEPPVVETPVVETPAPAPTEVFYIVQPGDVLWKIAQKYNLTYQELGDFNKLTNYNLIYPNQKLLIPAE